VLANSGLVAQFVVLHSLLLSARGRRWIARMAPFGLGQDLSTTIYVAIVSVQLLSCFALATAWTGYCLIGPLFKERRCLGCYGGHSRVIGGGCLIECRGGGRARCRTGPASDDGRAPLRWPGMTLHSQRVTRSYTRT
jgi:hypothetical protein